jgi:hypothetical protein
VKEEVVAREEVSVVESASVSVVAVSVVATDPPRFLPPLGDPSSNPGSSTVTGLGVVIRSAPATASSVR